jgi:S1-C subfamily serine protease
VTAANGTRASANVARRLESFDLALLKASVPLADYAPLGDSKSVEVGQRVWTLGFPVVDFLGIEPKFSDGSVSSLSGIEDAPQVFQVTVPVQPGNSGGPLVTEDGFVVGVVVSRAAELPFFRATGALPQGVNFAVKVDPARGLFVKPADLPKAASRSAAVARIKSAICFIESVTGDGLLSAPAGFGDGFVPARSSAEIFERNRKKCAAADPEGCLAAAKTLLSECAPSGVVTSGGCRHARFARTILDHACAVGRHDACTVH